MLKNVLKKELARISLENNLNLQFDIIAKKKSEGNILKSSMHSKRAQNDINKWLLLLLNRIQTYEEKFFTYEEKKV